LRTIPRARHAIIRSLLRSDVEGLASLTGDDADELLPMVTKVLLDALLQLVSGEEVERQLDEWFAKRPG
jgi:PhoPQ-activated pathogenicity-related protein